MANGSFGLSGFPAAPTTLSTGGGSGANNPAASVTATVQSADGFAAGELIYQRNNSFGTIPNNAASSATFPLTGLVPTMSAATSTQNNSSTTTNLGPEPGCSQNTNMAAKLTNGNIVYVFKAGVTSAAQGITSTSPYFKIIDQNGNTVVNTTAVDGTNAVLNNTIGVVALTGGGFVVYYNLNQNPRYAVFSNTGTVVTAAQTDTGVTLWPAGQGFFSMRAAARPDGAWVLCVKPTGSSTMQHRIYGATGTALYAWTANIAGQSFQYAFDLVCRADNSTVIVAPPATLTNGLSYMVFSSTNTTTVAQTDFTVLGGNSTPQNWGNVALLSDGNVLIGYYYTSNFAYRTLTPANVLSAERSLANSGGQFVTMNVCASSSGGFLVAGGGYIGTYSNPYSAVVYTAYNSAYTNVFGGYKLFTSIPYTGESQFTMFDTGSYLGLFFSLYNSPNVGAVLNSNSYTKFDKSTFFPIGFNPLTTTLGSTSALAVSGYARSASSPSGAAFLAATSSSQYASTTVSINFLSNYPTYSVKTGITNYEIDSTTFSDGRFAFIYRTSTGLVEVKVFSQANILLTTLVVDSAASTSSSNQGYVRIVQLSNGKFAVCYPNTSGTLTIKVYSSSFVELNSIVFTTINSTNSSGYQASLAPITGSRIVLAYSNLSNNASYTIFSDTLTTLTSEVTINFNTCYATSVTPHSFGFAYSYVRSGVTTYFSTFYETTTNTWSQTGLASNGSYAPPSNIKISSHPAGWFAGISANNTNGSSLASLVYLSSTSGLAQIGNNGNLNVPGYVTNGTTRVASCITANGIWASFMTNGSGSFYYVQQVPNIVSNASALTLTCPSGILLLTATPTVGNRVAVGYFNPNTSEISYTLLDVFPTEVAASITAGVTASNPSLALSQPTGYTLLGVSTTAATAGGTGTVQINGPATLNANYSTTQSAAFDFQNPVTYGVKGVVNGLNVNLQGNV